MIVTPGAQQQLPVGSAAQVPMAIVNDENAKPLGMVTAAATCPWSSQVVYDDPYVRIVVIYGANGEYIQIVTINKQTTHENEGVAYKRRSNLYRCDDFSFKRPVNPGALVLRRGAE